MGGGFSGGVDSTVLLHWLSHLSNRLPILALHVNHQLDPDAHYWAEAAANFSASLGIDYQMVSVDVAPGGSVEAAARAARYAAFEAVLGPGDVLILGHHADDQVETVVMNMLRGSERPGLQGMPSDRIVGQASLVRPFLKVERARLIAYAESHGLEWIEDPSNARVQHDRNFLRHDVLPTLDQRFVGWRRRIETALARDESFGQAVDEAVNRDLEVCLDGLGLRVDRLIKHSHARQRMILRRFLGERCPQQPSGRAIDEFLDQLRSSKARGRAELLIGDWTLDSDRGWIFLVSQKEAPLWLPEQWQGERFRRSGSAATLPAQRSRRTAKANLAIQNECNASRAENSAWASSGCERTASRRGYPSLVEGAITGGDGRRIRGDGSRGVALARVSTRWGWWRLLAKRCGLGAFIDDDKPPELDHRLEGWIAVDSSR